MAGRSLNIHGPTLTSAPWAGDGLDARSLVPGGAKLDATQFVSPDSVAAVVGVAGAAQGATSVPVAALSGPIPSGTVLDFGGAKFARTTAAAAAGATTLTVAALPTALVSTDTARYAGPDVTVSVPSGTVIGRTITERDAGTGFGPAASTDDEIFIVAFDVLDVNVISDVELYRHNRVVKETFMPGWTGLAGALKTAVRAAYICVNGQA